MSLLSEYAGKDNPLLKMVMDLTRRVEVLEAERNIGKRGPKTKPKKGLETNINRPIKDFILIQNEVPCRVLLLNENQSLAPVIEMTEDEYKLFLELIMITDEGESFTFREFKNTNKFARKDGDGWDIENI